MQSHVFDRRHAIGAIGALSLTSILRTRAQQLPDERRDTSVIFITLGGGPSQFETYDPKPEATSAIRGNFGAIGTNVDGVQFSELLPNQAKIMDRLAIIRSIHHEQASHIAEHIVETGYDLKNSRNSLVGEMPSIGSIVSAVRGPTAAGIPAFVTLPDRKAYGGPHWLGGKHRHFAVNADPNTDEFAIRNLTLDKRLNVGRLEDRRGLLTDLDRAQQSFEKADAAESIDAFNRQAFDLVAGEQARQALDIAAEPDAIRDRYGRHTLGQRMLLARRLIEVADVPFVTVRMGGWDDHKDLVKRITPRCAEFDQALPALIDDLHSRGLNKRVLVVAMGEFGRTPKINGTGGRDHWPRAGVALLSGGDYRMGQAIGATDKIGSDPIAAPYRPQNVQAMVYHHLGIDAGITFDDFSGRPRYALEERQLIQELI
ncbi:MAG: hypothetical protein ACI8UO_002433 [Verrucomicrobiales bacterium]|jgi:hypothetical protein